MRHILLYCALSGWVGMLAGILVAGLMMMAGRDTHSSSSELPAK